VAALGTGQDGYHVDGGSSLTAWGSALSTSGAASPAFTANGNLLGLYGTTVAMAGAGPAGQGIAISSGQLDLRSLGSAPTVLWGVQPGGHPAYGIVDTGASALSGDAAVAVNAAICFSGNLFDPVNTADVEETEPGPVPFMAGSSADRYALKDAAPAIRSFMNRARWTCGYTP
jgi:hypothetical protein